MKMTNPNLPSNLIDAIRHFADPMVCLEIVASVRWPSGPKCLACASKRLSFLTTRLMWKCLDCKKQFSVKVGTIFEDSAVSLDKWLTAMWLVANCKNGVSSYEVARDLKVTQKTAWFMLQRIRYAMHHGSIDKMTGEVEADETFIGGKARNMHADKRTVKMGGGKGAGMVGKIAVMGLLDRHTKTFRYRLPADTRTGTLDPLVRASVGSGSTVYTDALASYRHLHTEYVHKVIDHAERYAEGEVHTNALENFWSLLKRAIHGTYVSIEPFHLFRYLDEQAFRFNNRKMTDWDRFGKVLRAVFDRRLTYAELIGQPGSTGGGGDGSTAALPA